MSDGGGIGGGAPLGGGGGGRDVALPDRGGVARNYEPPSHLDRSSDPANRRKTSRGFPGEGHDDDRPRDEAERKGKQKRDLAKSVDKGHAQAERTASTKAARRAAVDPGDTSVAPQRFNAAAKEAWSAAPAEVRSEAHRAVRELEHGLRQYHARAVRDSTLDGWHNLAHSAGTSVDGYLRQVARVEMGLRSTNVAEKIAAIEHCLTLAGTNPWEYSQFVNQDTNEQRQARQTNLQIGAVQGQVQQLGRATADVAFTQMQQTNYAHVDATVKGFAAAHDDFLELSLDIAAEIASDPRYHEPRDQRLRAAYDVVRARKGRAGRSISGSPANGTNPSLPARRKGDRRSIADSLDFALARSRN